MTDMHGIWILAVCAAVTVLLRFLPFVLFQGKREVPPVIAYLGKVLPAAVMAMLAVYCLKGVSFTSAAGWLPCLISCTVVVLLHIWKRNTLLSIIAGTVSYMLLVQLVF